MLYQGPFTPSDSVTVTVALMGGTFDLFDGTVTGRMGCIPIFPVNVMVTVTESSGVNRPSKFPFAFCYIVRNATLCGTVYRSEVRTLGPWVRLYTIVSGYHADTPITIKAEAIHEADSRIH